MSFASRPEAWTVAVLLAAAAPASAQQAHAWREVQLWTAAVGSHPAAGVAGLGLAWRDADRTRFGVALGAGVVNGLWDPAGRAEATWHFLLDPGKRRGIGVYGGGGLALTIREHDHPRPWVQFVLGAEHAPGGGSGWFVEGGFGGGVRVAAGVRWRTARGPR